MDWSIVLHVTATHVLKFVKTWLVRDLVINSWFCVWSLAIFSSDRFSACNILVPYLVVSHQLPRHKKLISREYVCEMRRRLCDHSWCGPSYCVFRQTINPRQWHLDTDDAATLVSLCKPTVWDSRKSRFLFPFWPKKTTCW